MIIGHIVNAIESFAPPALQEGYDNSGLIIGNRNEECTGALITVDVTPAVVEEAKSLGFNLIVAHHPLIFKGLKRLNGSTPQEIAVIEAVRTGIAVYACHTSLDSAPGGVSQEMARMLGMENVEPLDSPTDKLLKLQVFVPDDCVDEVSMALFDAGAGQIGNYDSCAYSVKGTGSFRALSGANPYVGAVGEVHTENETAVQMVLPEWRRRQVEAALRQVHPYEEPAYEFVSLINARPMTGLGAIGNLSEPMTMEQFVAKVKHTFDSPVARCNNFPDDFLIRRVALCGGSGASLIPLAMAKGATAMLTSDVKYHDFVDTPASSFLIVDIGHHESENCSKRIIFDIISEKFPNFALRYSSADVNPIKYL